VHTRLADFQNLFGPFETLVGFDAFGAQIKLFERAEAGLEKGQFVMGLDGSGDAKELAGAQNAGERGPDRQGRVRIDEDSSVDKDLRMPGDALDRPGFDTVSFRGGEFDAHAAGHADAGGRSRRGVLSRRKLSVGE